MSADLGSVHWRQLETASGQISLLRKAVSEGIAAAIEDRREGRLLRLLLIGADHAVVASDRINRRSGLEVIITDLDSDRLDQARAALGEDVPHIRCIPWVELDGWPAGTFDLAGAIDALSEIAAMRDGLSRIGRLLRPKAPIVAG